MKTKKRSKRRKSYYLPDGTYFDTTTGRTYETKAYCEICGINLWGHITDVHHYLQQQKCLRDLETIDIGKSVTPSTWTQEFINEHQRLYTVCRECHNAIHARGKKQIINGRNLRDYLWHKEKTEVVTKPKIYVVKKELKNG